MINETTGELEEISIQVWKPDLKNSTLPVNTLVEKSAEYKGKMEGGNVFGYLTYNGFTATGLNERKKSEKGSKHAFMNWSKFLCNTVLFEALLP